MIEVEKLTKRYGDLTAIEDVSFTVQKGEIVGFLGPNGAGKTTTMRIITGFIPADGGTVKVAGLDIFDNPLDVKRQIGYLPEIPPLYGEMKVAGYLRYIGKLKGIERGKLGAEIERVAALTGLGQVLDRIVSNMSKGFRQRIGLAQALLGNPPVIILDEPTIGLDPNQIVEIRGLIKSLAGEHTVLLSTHILPEVMMTCQRVIIIHNGRVVAAETIGRLVSAEDRKSVRTAVKLRRSDGAEALLRGLPGVSGVTADPFSPHGFVVEGAADAKLAEAISSAAIKADLGLVEVREISETLEEVFHKLTSEEKGVSA